MTSRPSSRARPAISQDLPTLIVHVDINKTILAIDEVKGYGRMEVTYLEHFKDDEAFLEWAVEHKSDGAADTTS